jgi:hypothetical protein
MLVEPSHGLRDEAGSDLAVLGQLGAVAARTEDDHFGVFTGFDQG